MAITSVNNFFILLFDERSTKRARARARARALLGVLEVGVESSGRLGHPPGEGRRNEEAAAKQSRKLKDLGCTNARRARIDVSRFSSSPRRVAEA